MRLSLLGILLAASCSTEPAKTVELPRVAAGPVTPVDASLPPAPSATQAATGKACLMLYECGCNAGCTPIDQPLSGLTEGMQVGVVSGPLAGSRVFVAKNRTDDGDVVFTLQRADPKQRIQICSTGGGPVLGYLCAMDKSGAARKCDSCN